MMAGPMYQRSARSTPTPESVVDTSRLWGGGLATAAVACLVAFAGVLIARGVFDIELLSPKGEGTFGDSTTGAYIVMAGMGALLGTLFLQILIALDTPRPLSFFSWIIGLMTLIFAIIPFTTDAKLSSPVATGLLNLCIGLVILTLLPQIGYAAIRSDASADAVPQR
jgi:hypothetical protein